MNLKDFKSGALRQEYQYKSFVPSTINHNLIPKYKKRCCVHELCIKLIAVTLKY